MKKIEIMADRVKEAVQQTPDLNELALVFNVKVDTASIVFSGMNRSTIGRENDVVGELFSFPAGQLNGPLEGNFGVYVVFIDDIIEAPAKDNFVYEQRNDMQGWNNRVSNSLYDALKKQAAIEDNREMFY